MGATVPAPLCHRGGMRKQSVPDVSYSGGRASARAIRKSITPSLGPQWIGVPSVGHCPITGLSRPHIYNLIAAGLIRSACLRQPGAIRGRRLVYLPSVLAYLDRCADEETARFAQAREGAT